MPEIQVKDKLITLEELGVAASGFKGTLTANDDLNNILSNGYWEASADSLPSNVPSGVTTHSFILNYNLPNVSEVYQIFVTFASGKPVRWERRYFSGSWGDWCKIPIASDVVAKTGDTMTGPLEIGADIVQTAGYIKGSANDGINHAIKLGHANDNVMEFNEYGGLFNFYRNEANPRELVFQINTKSGTSTAPLSIGSGGTQASNSAGARTNLSVPYTSRGIFVNSFSEIPTEEGMYTVAYTGTDTNAPLLDSAAWWWNVIQLGTETRLTQIAFSPYRNREYLYMRVKHDTTWYGWFAFQGTTV